MPVRAIAQVRSSPVLGWVAPPIHWTIGLALDSRYKLDVAADGAVPLDNAKTLHPRSRGKTTKVSAAGMANIADVTR